MRVVSGRFKGKTLKAVPGQSTRPTTDKVKEAIFNMIGPYFDGGICLDLFAGSGGLGIEGLSRGLDKGIFVDIDGKAIQTIKSNVETCKCDDRVEIYRTDYKRALKALVKREIVFDYIFLDPPYHKKILIDILQFINENQLLQPSGAIICEHSHQFDLPDRIEGLRKTKEETYGIISISIYQYENEQGGS